MAVITIGPGATNRDNQFPSGYTIIDKGNPASGTGTLSSASFYFYASSTGVIVGTFYGSVLTYQDRGNESIGNVTAGSKQTFTGLDIEVESGDYLGVYYVGTIERDTVGNTAVMYKKGYYFGGAAVYKEFADDAISIEASGVTATAAIERNGVNVTEINGVAVVDLNI